MLFAALRGAQAAFPDDLSNFYGNWCDSSRPMRTRAIGLTYI